MIMHMMTGMMRRMIGKMNNFNDIFNKQLEFQQMLCNNIGYGEKLFITLPKDKPELASYHIQQLISEIGEVLQADKRWKNFRNDHIDMVNKKEEIADCFIVLMNVAIYSGMSSEELFEQIENKIKKNFDRIK